jgi:hypothetical protein
VTAARSDDDDSPVTLILLDDSVPREDAIRVKVMSTC